MIIQAVLVAAAVGFAGGPFGSRPAQRDTPSASCSPVVGADGYYTASIQDCLDTGSPVVVLPEGEWVVKPAGSFALQMGRHGASIRGAGPESTKIKLWRKENGFSEARLIAVNGINASIRDITLSGGMGPQTCEQAKYDEYADGGQIPGSQGQQSHLLFVSGTDEDPTENFSLRNVVFEESSGDSIFLYNVVKNTEFSDMTIGGFCRSGLTMNGYTEGGISNIRVLRVNFDPQSVAQPSSRGIDIEPNAYLSDITIEDVRLPRFESGRVNTMVVKRMTMEARNGIAPSGAAFGGRGSGLRISDSHFEESSDGVTQSALEISASDAIVTNSTVLNTDGLYGVSIPGQGGNYPTGVILDGVTVRGEAVYSVSATGVGNVTIRNSTLAGSRGVYFFAGLPDSKLVVENTEFVDGGTGGDLRSVFVRGTPHDGGVYLGGVYVSDSAGPGAVDVNSDNGVFPNFQMKVCDSNFPSQSPPNSLECE